MSALHWGVQADGGVLQATGDLDYLLLLPVNAFDWLRAQKVLMCVLSCSGDWFDYDAGLEVGTGAPAEDQALLVNSEGVAGSCGHFYNDVVF